MRVEETSLLPLMKPQCRSTSLAIVQIHWAKYGSFTNTIEQARVRTRAVGRKLRGVEQIDAVQAENLLELAGVKTVGDLDEIEAESGT